MKETINKLTLIQSELKAPKEQFNKFGNYAYRNCEDILESLKPLLKKYGCSLTIEDEIFLIGERYYVKATATMHTEKDSHSVSAFARESQDKKGMDDSQITGSTSSYARKYALNGMFLIDDTKDADSTNKHEEKQTQPNKQQTIVVADNSQVMNSKPPIQTKSSEKPATEPQLKLVNSLYNSNYTDKDLSFSKADQMIKAKKK